MSGLPSEVVSNASRPSAPQARRIAELEQQIWNRDKVIGELTIASRILKKHADGSNPVEHSKAEGQPSTVTVGRTKHSRSPTTVERKSRASLCSSTLLGGSLRCPSN